MSQVMMCRECGSVQKNVISLVNHIFQEHGGLEEYVARHGQPNTHFASEQPEQQPEQQPEPVKPRRSRRSASADTVNFMGTSLSKRTGLDENIQALVPKKDPHYRYQEFVEEVAYDISQAIPVALTGHCGTGKTSLIYQMASELNVPVMRVNTNQQTTIQDFIGSWVVKGSEMVWVDGALPFAMRHGCWLIIDEIDYAEPEILSALNAVLESGRTLMLSDKGEAVKAHDDFRIFSTGNTLGQMAEFRSLYQGTNIMNEAFVDRWRVYIVDYMNPENETALIKSRYSRLDDQLATVMVTVGNTVRKMFVEEDVQCTFSTRRLLDWAEVVTRPGYAAKHKTKTLSKAAEHTIFSKISREDAEAIKGVIQR